LFQAVPAFMGRSISMVRFGRTRFAVAALLAAALWATPPPVRADFQVRLYEDGQLLTAPGTISDNGTGLITYSGQAGDFSVSLSFTSTSPGAGNLGIVSTDSSRITNRSSAEHTLTVALSSQGFNVPNGGPLTLVNSVSGTVGRGTLTGDFSSYADRNNTLFGTSDLTAPTVTFAASTTGFVDPDLGPGAAPLSNSFSGMSLNYGFDSELVYSITSVANFDLTGGASVNFSATSEVHAPAPPGLVLALSGIPLLGLGSWFQGRRRAL
jgi:hypothetical protein